jgi:hypothetical protein
MTIQSTTGNQLRLDCENMLVDMMAAIGIELHIDNVPSSELFGSWESGAFRKHGNFDILMYTSSPSLDPHNFMFNYFYSTQMPTYANDGAGWNYVRWINPAYDAAIDLAGATPDLDARQTAYQTACEEIAEDIPHLYLYARSVVFATRSEIRGFQVNPVGNQTWNAADWDRPCCETTGWIGTDGGSLTSYFGDAEIGFPAGAFTEPVIFTIHSLTETMPTGFLVGDVLAFELSAVYSSTGQTAALSPGSTYTFTISYAGADIAPAIEDTLALYFWQDDQWVLEPTSVLDTASKTITATPDHFSEWAILGETNRIYLPVLFVDH